MTNEFQVSNRFIRGTVNKMYLTLKEKHHDMAWYNIYRRTLP